MVECKTLREVMKVLSRISPVFHQCFSLFEVLKCEVPGKAVLQAENLVDCQE